MLRDKQRSLRIWEDGYQFDLLDVKLLVDSDFKWLYEMTSFWDSDLGKILDLVADNWETKIVLVSMKNFPHLLLRETLCYIESNWEASLGNIYTVRLNLSYCYNIQLYDSNLEMVRLNLCYYYNIQLYDSNLETTPNIELNDKIFSLILG